MSGEMKSANSLTSLLLTESNWQLWRREAIIGLERLEAYGIATGDEPCPQAPTASSSTPSTNFDVRPAISHDHIAVDRSRLTTILQNAEQARQALDSSPDDLELQSRTRDAESELLQFMLTTSRSNEQSAAPQVRGSNPASTQLSDWKRRHSKAYHLLLGSLSISRQ
jgi:hypothetical protein